MKIPNGPGKWNLFRSFKSTKTAKWCEVYRCKAKLHLDAFEHVWKHPSWMWHHDHLSKWSFGQHSSELFYDFSARMHRCREPCKNPCKTSVMRISWLFWEHTPVQTALKAGFCILGHKMSQTADRLNSYQQHIRVSRIKALCLKKATLKGAILPRPYKYQNHSKSLCEVHEKMKIWQVWDMWPRCRSR